MLPPSSDAFLHLLTHSMKDIILDVLTPSDGRLGFSCIICGGTSGVYPRHNSCGNPSPASSSITSNRFTDIFWFSPLRQWAVDYHSAQRHSVNMLVWSAEQCDFGFASAWE